MFYLYSTLGCHLCDDAQVILSHLTKVLLFEGLEWVYEVIDISEDAGLFKCYGVRIPVLHYDGAEVDLAWPFDLAAANAYVLEQLK